MVHLFINRVHLFNIDPIRKEAKKGERRATYILLRKIIEH